MYIKNLELQMDNQVEFLSFGHFFVRQLKLKIVL